MSMKAQYGQPKDNYHSKILLKSTIIYIVCILLALICLVPIYILLVDATYPAKYLAQNSTNFWFGDHLKQNLMTLFEKKWDPIDVVMPNGKVNTVKFDASAGAQYHRAFNLIKGYGSSLIIAGCTTILSVFFAALTAYGLTVYDFKLKGPAYTFIIAVMMIPAQVSSTGFVNFMYSLHLMNNLIPLIVPSIAAPAIIFFMKSYMKSSFPLDIVEAARIDGCGEMRTFLTIAIPMMKPAIAVQAIFAFVANWNNYYTQNMILKDTNDGLATIPIMVSKVLGFDHNVDTGVNYLCIVLSILPIVIIYFILSRFIIAGVALGGVKE